MTSTRSVQVSIHAGWLWLLRLGCPLIGFGLGFGIQPFVRWALSTISSIPAPLRIAAEIPQYWLAAILTVVGIGFGYWLSAQARRDSLTVTVSDDGIIAAHGDTERYIQHSHVGLMFTDPKEFVVLNPDGYEIFRGPATDLPQGALAAALREHGYPWYGSHDPHEAEYRRWIDGHPNLDHQMNTLLRARRRALDANDRAEADRIHTQLHDHGVVVRDRDKTQQYRRVTDKNDDEAEGLSR